MSNGPTTPRNADLSELEELAANVGATVVGRPVGGCHFVRYPPQYREFQSNSYVPWAYRSGSWHSLALGFATLELARRWATRLRGLPEPLRDVRTNMLAAVGWEAGFVDAVAQARSLSEAQLEIVVALQEAPSRVLLADAVSMAIRLSD